MRVAMVYYSRTGYTERLVNELKLDLANKGFVVDVFRVIPIREYSKPLHINPRLIYDTPY
ncbi:flavodoxin family protein [Candidatus Bathyarchaeota archaeon]|nr:flavodoxin family protein [Candidatus Bathyarchaeota archaeon]